MGNHIHSSLVCAARLLRLAGVNAESVEILGKNATVDLSTRGPLASLQQYLSQLSRATSTRFKMKKRALNKIKPEQLPLAFRDTEGRFILLARLNDNEALLQHADSSKPQIISYQLLSEMWGGWYSIVAIHALIFGGLSPFYYAIANP